MAALLGLDVEAAEEVAREAATADEVCEVANDNAPGQVVVYGLFRRRLRPGEGGAPTA
jgi:[acyl-carrier-protein] S-malonyltransferase